MRLIDADALKKTLEDMCSASNNIKQRRAEDIMLHNIFPQIIDDEPTVDAQPVKHGRWERRMTKIYACSECTNEVTDRQRKNYSFCPYCGSKQDLGGD